MPYSAGASIVGDAHGFCATFGPGAEIRCRDHAGLRRLARLELPLPPVTEAHVAMFSDEAFDPANPRRNSALRRMRDVLPFPARVPATQFEERYRRVKRKATT